MGVMLLKKFGLLFLLISSSLFLSCSSAGRLSKFTASNSEKQMGTIHDQEELLGYIHGRLLKDNTRDYGRYDPTPALVKPPFKLIPN